jgi:hypothetical protein
LTAPNGLAALDQQLVELQTATPLRKQQDVRLVRHGNPARWPTGKPDVITATQFHGWTCFSLLL